MIKEKDNFEIKIHNYNYDVYFANNDTIRDIFFENKAEKEDIVVFGFVRYREQEIYINVDTSKDREFTTLMHELTHAYINSFSISIDGEEDVCDLMGQYAAEIYDLAIEIMDKHYNKENNSNAR